MVDVRQTEPERRAAIEELTALRRELKTETAAGAKAAKSDPRFIAAQQRLDAAKSAAGMRTSAQDLAALNKVATRNVSTADMTPSQRKQERQALNQPSRQYFKQVTQAQKESLTDLTRVPFWKPANKVTQQIINENKRYGWDMSNARFDWVLVGEPGEQKWAVSLIGGRRIPPTGPITTLAAAKDQFMSDTETLGEVTNKYVRSIDPLGWREGLGGAVPTSSSVTLDELAEAIPEIKYSQLQEIIYQLTLEKDNDITIEDVLDKYDEMYGEG